MLSLVRESADSTSLWRSQSLKWLPHLLDGILIPDLNGVLIFQRAPSFLDINLPASTCIDRPDPITSPSPCSQPLPSLLLKSESGHAVPQPTHHAFQFGDRPVTNCTLIISFTTTCTAAITAQVLTIPCHCQHVIICARFRTLCDRIP